MFQSVFPAAFNLCLTNLLDTTWKSRYREKANKTAWENDKRSRQMKNRPRDVLYFRISNLIEESIAGINKAECLQTLHVQYAVILPRGEAIVIYMHNSSNGTLQLVLCSTGTPIENLQEKWKVAGALAPRRPKRFFSPFVRGVTRRPSRQSVRRCCQPPHPRNFCSAISPD